MNILEKGIVVNSKKSHISIFVLLLLIIVNCNSQNNNKIIINEEEMEQNNKETHNVFKDYIPVKQFDIKKFNAKNKKGEYSFIDASRVTEWDKRPKESIIDEYIRRNTNGEL